MKKIVFLVLMMALTCSAKAFVGYAVIDNFRYFLDTEAQTAEVCQNNNSGKVVIPATVAYEGVECKVTSIGDEAFWSCGLQSVVIPEGVTKIGTRAFGSNSWLTEVNLPSSVTFIGPRAFESCANLTKVNIPEGVTTIYSYTFSYCYNLTTITLPESVTEISGAAFGNCPALTSINIPQSVTRIGMAAFHDCPCLKDVYCYAAQVPETVSEAFNNTPINDATLHVPASSIDLYKDAEPWKYFKEIVALGTTGVNQVKGKNLQIRCNGGNLLINGAPAGAAISVYNLSGQLIGSATATTGTTMITLQNGAETCIVKVGNKTKKVAVQ